MILNLILGYCIRSCSVFCFWLERHHIVVGTVSSKRDMSSPTIMTMSGLRDVAKM